MPDDMIFDAMTRLSDDPHEFRRRRDEALRKIASIMADPPQSSHISCEFDLDFSLAPSYEICHAFLSVLLDDGEREDGENTVDDDVVMYIFCQGLQAELHKIEILRDRLNEMGSMEPLADEIGMDIGDEERAILSAKSDVISESAPSMDEYFSSGYVGARCPKCRKKAVWHPMDNDLICLDGCGRVGVFATRPKPE